MSDPLPASHVKTLPERPSLEHLKNQARKALREIRATVPGAKLADAQLQIARAYGFSSWRALKSFVEAQAVPARRYPNLTGFYRHNQAIMANAVVSISEARGKLWLRAVNGATFALRREEDGRFALDGTESWFLFDGAETGPATALISQGKHHTFRLERVDAAAAQAIIEAGRQAEADQARPRTAIELPPEKLEPLVGHYMLPAGPAIEISVRNGGLFAQVSGQPAIEVYPESETDFFYRVLPAQLSFVIEGREAVAVILHQNGLAQRMGRATAEAAEQVSAPISNRLAEQQQPRTRVVVAQEALERCEGRYRLDAARILEATAEPGRFFVEITGQPRLEVYPESETSFFWTVVAAQISFVLDPAEPRAIHAVLHQSGRDFPLPRIDDEGVEA
ncbi:MAG: DUF3471 domain-containing protein [Sphingobium sp.]|nr:DUF3471 domain-containing protein [Sphingobium sp.]